MYRSITLAVLALAAAPLYAEPAVVVTLGGVGDRIRSQNPDLAAARLRIQEALGRMNQSGRLENPSLESAVEHNPRFNEGRIEVGISQKFPVTNRLRLEKEVSLTELKSAEAEVRDVERQLTGEARGIVVKLMAARERRALLRKQTEIADDFSDFLSEIAAKGEGSALDAGQAKLEAASLAMESRQLDATEASLAGELKPLLGMRPGESVAVSGSLPEPELPSAAVDPSRRPDYQAASLDAQAATQGVALEESRRYEDWEGGVFTGVERSEDAPDGFENEAIVGVQMKIPLPLWNKNEGAIQEAEARRTRKEMETAALARGIRLEADGALGEMRRWQDMIREINDVLLPLADEQTGFAETTFRDGQGEIQSVLRSREKRLQLALARLDAVREFHLARVRYETATGKR